MKYNIPKELNNKSVIYQIKNLVNGKVYIGQTVFCYQRYCEHLSSLSNNRHHNNYLQKSWNKHGKDNFEFSILELFDNKITKKELNKAEQEHISVYLINDLINKKKCYNSVLVADSKKEEYNFYKKIYQYDLNGIFIAEYNGAGEIARKYGFNPHHINECCVNKRKSASGFIWSCSIDSEEIMKKIEINNTKLDNRSFPIQCIDICTNNIKIFNSIAEASKYLNIRPDGISKCCNRKLKTYHKMKFSFIENKSM